MTLFGSLTTRETVLTKIPGNSTIGRDLQALLAQNVENRAMQIVIKLFALLREKAGTDTVLLEVPPHALLSQAVQCLLQQHPALTPYMDRVRFARHMEFIETASLLAEGDEIALIPPVSGGR